GRA
ncbi:hypothetical protein, partial [Achromobacter phage kwar_LB4]